MVVPVRLLEEATPCVSVAELTTLNDLVTVVASDRVVLLEVLLLSERALDLVL